MRVSKNLLVAHPLSFFKDVWKFAVKSFGNLAKKQMILEFDLRNQSKLCLCTRLWLYLRFAHIY